MSEIWLAGKRVTLSPTAAIGKGGEADVYDLGGGRALKVFKAADHPDLAGDPAAQRAAEARLALHQTKLREFPRGLPARVVAPEALASDKAGTRILGYVMRLVPGAEPLHRYSEPLFRRGGPDGNAVVAIFRDLAGTVGGLHRAGVVIGDFNDLNVLVAGGTPYVIDADSFQFGAFACTVFTDRFVDPRLCDPAAPSPLQVRPYDEDADWYAFHLLLMQSLLTVGPWGGIYRPADPARRIPAPRRALDRISVFHPEVQYPKPARPLATLPDELLGRLEETFVKDRRGAFPPALLDTLRFTTCARCGTEHARALCPGCVPAGAGRPSATLQVRGSVTCTSLAKAPGPILAVSLYGDAVLWLARRGEALVREDGRTVLEGPLPSPAAFLLDGPATWVATRSEAVRLEAGKAPERLALDSALDAVALVRCGRHRFWVQQGTLVRAAEPWGGSEPWGQVLEGQTRLWGGPAFGLGLYRAGALTVAFLFDAERRGLQDGLRLPPLRGQLIEARASLDERRAWLLLRMQDGPATRHLALCYERSGALAATAEAAPGAGWLGAWPEPCAAGGALLVPTDQGLTRVEVQGGSLAAAREFPDTEPFVDGASRLLVGPQGVLVIGTDAIHVLRLRP